jgi:hypothetical protein
MNDLKFDPVARDLIIENGDFVIESNPSVQNGAIIRDAHCFSVRFPIFGIGLQRLINTPIGVANFEMNRWIAQVKSDGGTKANFTIDNIGEGLIQINNKVSYV